MTISLKRSLCSAGKFPKGRRLSWICSVALQGFGFSDFDPFGGYGEFAYGKAVRIANGKTLGRAGAGAKVAT